MLNQRGNHALIVLVVVLVVSGIGGAGYAVNSRIQSGKGSDDPITKSDDTSIATYEECIKADGSRIQESYPEVCVTKDGKSFPNPKQSVEDVSANYLEIKEWKVRIKVGTPGAYYKPDIDVADLMIIYSSEADALVGPSGKSCKGEYVAYLKRAPEKSTYWKNANESGYFSTRRTVGDNMYGLATKKQYGPECFDDAKTAEYDSDTETSGKFQEIVDDFKSDFMTIEAY